MTPEELKEYKRQYYLANQEKIKAKAAAWKEANKERAKQNSENYRKNNPGKIKKWRSENQDKIKEWRKNYKANNKEKRNEYERNKKATDPKYKLGCDIRRTIIDSFKKKFFSKTSKTYSILGCTLDEFKIYLESKFEPWMTWENRGLYNGELNYGWDIDHIIPLDTAETIQDIIRLNHYTNLQPLCSKVNRDIKKNIIANLL
jgi:hypothetical protein